MRRGAIPKRLAAVAVVVALLSVGLTGTVLAGPGEAPLDHQAREASGWPCWRGPTGSGSAADYPGEVIQDIARAKWIWNGEDRNPVEYNGTCSKITGSGCVSPIFWNNRLYLVYHSASSLRRLDAERIGHTYVRPGQKPIALTPERRDKMVAGYCGGSGQHQAKFVDGKPAYTEEMAANYLFNLYNDNVAVCLDADTGKVLWRDRFLSQFKGQTGSYHNSPCIDDGRLYMLTPGMTRVLCLDAMTGELLWDRCNDQGDMALQQSIATRKRLLSRDKLDMGNAGIQHSIVVDGYLICAAGIYDARTGERIRDGYPVATRWVHKGREYLLAGNSCYDLRTGKALWTVKEVNFGMGRNSGGNPAVTENHMVAWVRGKGWVGYRLRLDGAKELWSLPDLKHSTGAAVIHKGFAVTGGSDRLGRCLIAVDVETGEIAGKLHYNQKGSKRFPPSPLNNLWCGITSAVAMDGHVFWRRFRSGGGGLTMMTLPIEGRGFSVSIKDGPLLGYSHTPAAGDGRLFVRMKSYMRCLDFRRNPPAPRAVPPDPACRELTGPMARLGSAYQSERDAAVEALAQPADASVPDLVKLLTAGRYPTAKAAAAALARATSVKKAAVAALARALEATGEDQPPTRLGLHLHALHGSAPQEATNVTRALLAKAKGDSSLLVRVCKALAQPVFANEIGLHKSVLPDLTAALTLADETTLCALGEGMCYLDLEPDLLTPLVSDLIAAMRRTGSTPFPIQRALLLGLEKCTDESVFRQAAAFAVESWPPQGGGGGWSGSTLFPLAVLNACPATVAEIALPKLVQWPHRSETELLRKIGPAAILALVTHYPKSRGKTPGMILRALRELGPDGETAANRLAGQ